jgi:hypothetical protein
MGMGIFGLASTLLWDSTESKEIWKDLAGNFEIVRVTVTQWIKELLVICRRKCPSLLPFSLPVILSLRGINSQRVLRWRLFIVKSINELNILADAFSRLPSSNMQGQHAVIQASSPAELSFDFRTLSGHRIGLSY